MFLVSKCTCICMNSSADTWWCDVYFVIYFSLFSLLLPFLLLSKKDHTKYHPLLIIFLLPRNLVTIHFICKMAKYFTNAVKRGQLIYCY